MQKTGTDSAARPVSDGRQSGHQIRLLAEILPGDGRPPHRLHDVHDDGTAAECTPGCKVSAAQRKAWEFFETFDKPFLCACADNDPVTAGADIPFRERVPGARGLPLTTIKDGGHFVQENSPDQVAKLIIDLIRTTSISELSA
ncbi:MAG: hypothetical protein KDI31_11215 [Pseudomonadales bacterium]|nr:hypothetical protein [Pseudomonadales bacterium]